MNNIPIFAKQKLNGVDGAYACNHIQYFKDDIKLIKDAGFKAYRFSFSWPIISFFAFKFSVKRIILKTVDEEQGFL